MNNLKKAYLLFFVYEFKDGHEDIILLGIFSTKSKANEAISKLKKNPELKSMSKYLVIDENLIERVSWKEGYITVE